MVECGFTSTETVGLLGTGAQDGRQQMGIFVQFLHFEANWRPRLVSPLRGTDAACDNYGDPAWPSGKAVRR